MIVKTNLCPKDYTPKEVVRIVNIKQQIFYMNHNVYPIDMCVSYDLKNDRQVIIMIFEKEKTQELYQKWVNYNTN